MEPEKGTAWRPNHSGNNVSWDGSAVVKRFTGDLTGYYREQATLAQLAELPVPRVMPSTRLGELHLEYVDGVNGSEAVELGQAGDLLRELGRFLRRLHAMDCARLSAVLPGDGEAIVHGDYAHYNCLMSRGGDGLAAVLDWETAHLGSRVEDLAWCEFHFRNKFPQHQWAIARLFEGYGSDPGYDVRQEAIEARMKDLRRTPARTLHLMRFQQFEESAAFVAALSRVLNSPHNVSDPAAEVWTCEGTADLCLNSSAVQAAAGAFGYIRVSGLVAERAGNRLLLGGARPRSGAWKTPGARLSLVHFLFRDVPTRVLTQPALWAVEHFCGFFVALQLPL